MQLFTRYLAIGVLIGAAFFSVIAQNSTLESHALFPIEQNSKWGYIDVSGKIVIEPRFEVASEFSEDLALVQIDGKYGFINEKGDLVIKAQYSSAHDFSEGLARVQVGGDKYGQYGKWGFIDQTGQMVIEAQYGEINAVGGTD